MKSILLSAALLVITVLNGFSQKPGNQNGLINHDSTDPIVASYKNPPPVTIQAIAPIFQFDDFPINHNEHIASDGLYYYTINGGNAATGQISQFDLAGNLIQVFPIMIDGRGLSYNATDGYLYASLYTGDIVKITSLSAGTDSLMYTAIMQDGQASFAISPNGTKFYDFFNGNLFIRDFFTGSIIDTITGLSYGPGNFGGNAAVAVDANFIYTWDATIKTVYVYDLLGTFVQTMVLDSGDNGMSLSVFDNKLFVSRDGNYAMGTWYAYPLASFNYNNTCLGDSTFFTTYNSLGALAVSWNFGDTASGLNNLAFVTNPSHLFSDTGTYMVQMIKYYTLTNDTFTIAVTIGSPPVFDLGPDTTICSGTSLLLNPGGSYSSYMWQDGSIDSSFMVVDSGLFYVTITNNGCSARDSIYIITSLCSQPSANFASSDTSFCEKKCLDFTDLSTNNPTSWQWFFPGADSLSSNGQNPTGICYSAYGSFDVTLIACNASGCDTIHLINFINEYQAPPIPVITSNLDTIFSTPAFSYQWYNTSGSPIAGAINQFYVFQQPGGYYVIVKDSNGCASSSNAVYTSIVENTGLNGEIFIVPNPSDGNFEINFLDLNNSQMELKIFDAVGRLLFERNSGSDDNKIKLKVAEGIYFLHITRSGKIYRTKFVVKNY